MNNEKHWLAIYTRPRWEKKVAKLFTNKNIENYCPLNTVVRQWSDRKKIVHEPLFSSYVFVHTCTSEYIRVKETDGVLNFVYWLGQPAIIKNEEIESLKSFLADFTNVALEKIDVNINDEVKIIHGPLVSMEGKVIEVQFNHVKIMLPSIGYSLVARIPKSHIERVKVHRITNSNNNSFTKLSPL
jgi:transcription termination/antitermination protein NusG